MAAPMPNMNALPTMAPLPQLSFADDSDTSKYRLDLPTEGTKSEFYGPCSHVGVYFLFRVLCLRFV